MTPIFRVRMKCVAQLARLRTSSRFTRKVSKMDSTLLSNPFYHPESMDNIKRIWLPTSETSNNDVASIPLDRSATTPIVIGNPVNAHKLEEPIERKREYWSDNLLYILRFENLIPKDQPVVMDKPTPAEPYRLSSNVVRLVKQEPNVYVAKSNLKPRPFNRTISSFESTQSSYHSSIGSRPSSLLSSNHHSSPARLYSTVSQMPGHTNAVHDWMSIDWDPSRYLTIPKEYYKNDTRSEVMLDFWLKNRQKPATYAKKVKMIRYLEAYLRRKRLCMTGSSANGFGFDDADIDLTCQDKRADIPDQPEHNEAHYLRVVHHQLRNLRTIKNIKLINAITPILKFTYKDPRSSDQGMQVDMNNSNSVGLMNTQLLFSYSRMDPRVGPIVGVSKRWANNVGIKSAMAGTLSSYALTLLVLHYLQTNKVVPVLHAHVKEFANSTGFPPEDRLYLPKFKSSNHMLLGDLFRGFLSFYADFDFEKSCISVRCGHVMTLDEALELDTGDEFTRHSSRSWWKYVKVQEPFNFTNVARSVYTEAKFDQILKAFKQSKLIIERKDGLQSLLR